MASGYRNTAVLEDLQSGDGSVAVVAHAPSVSHAGIAVVAAILTVIASAAVCVAAVLVPAPAAALPLVVAVCVGCPIFAGWELPAAVASLRAERAQRTDAAALVKLREGLERLPEIEHPLGF